MVASQTSSAGVNTIHVSAKEVTVAYGPVVALDGFTADIPRGIVGLLGPNGAGKSTFIKACLGLLSLDRGAISVGGFDSQAQSLLIRDRVGYMPEHDCLIQSVNAVELVSHLGMISGMISLDAMQRCHEVLDFVGIGEERYRPIKSYSTGMKQKIKLAQAIIHDPELLFLDEPTSGMDPQGREELLDLVKKMASSEKTIIVSSHILQDVERVCDYAVIIDSGRLVKSGDMRALLAGEEGVRSISVRGDAPSLQRYVKALEKLCRIIDKKDDVVGQLTLLVRGCEDGRLVFRLAAENGVQMRRFHPERLDLEEVFLRAFRGGGRDGH
ncbi:MAG: ABC transporter ATP-binding protein [Candidatus Thermoplasmatota archaeon]|nr:ABC transporter ATP-binding protein [Candidatus Thermoplasmatota archaeon]